MPEKSEFDKALGELYDLTEWEDAEAAIRELHARGPEIERLYLDSKILPGELRKMTDDKLVEHIDHIREEAYNTGYSEAEAQRASTPAPGKTLPQLLEQLDAGECKGIKSATAYKIAEFAREQGYLE